MCVIFISVIMYHLLFAQVQVRLWAEAGVAEQIPECPTFATASQVGTLPNQCHHHCLIRRPPGNGEQATSGPSPGPRHDIYLMSQEIKKLSLIMRQQILV